MRKFALWLLVLLLCLLLCAGFAEEEESSFIGIHQPPAPEATAAPRSNTPVVPEKEEDAGIRYEADGSVILTITAVGDVTIGRNAQSSSTIFNKELDRQDGDKNFIFRNVRGILGSDDLTIINFEGTLAEEYTIPREKRENSFLFIADPSFAQALKDCSVEVATIENNHIDDFGAKGRSDTQKAIADVGVQWADEYHPTVYEAQGLRIAVLSYKTFDYYDTLNTKVPREVAAAKAENDLVVVCFHWGAEKDYAPNDRQKKLGRATIDAGADLVIGHHSHRINPIEKYKGKYIVYSVGNFSFAGNSKPDDMSTFIFQTQFRFQNGEIIANPFRIIPCRISSKTDHNDFAPTPYTEALQINNVIKNMLGNSKKLDYAVADYPLDWE